MRGKSPCVVSLKLELDTDKYIIFFALADQMGSVYLNISIHVEFVACILLLFSWYAVIVGLGAPDADGALYRFRTKFEAGPSRRRTPMFAVS